MKNQRSKPGSAATAVAAGDPILGLNGCRSSILFSLTGANPVFIWPLGNPGANDGILLNSNTPVILLCSCDFSPVIPGEWYAWSPAGASSVAWVEIMENDKR